MTINLTPTPYQRFVDSNGNALVGGLLYTYQAGTSTPAATYTDSTGGTPNANPIVLNTRGEASIWLDTSQTYKFQLKDSGGVLIWTQDQISPAVNVGDVTNGSLTYLTSVSGTNTITASLASLVSYTAGQSFRFVASGANTGAVTLNVNSLGAKAITKNGTVALQGGEIISGQAVSVIYDGTQFQLVDNPRLTSATAVASTSGTSIDFSVPSWAKRITLTLAGVSTNGTSNLQVQIGDSGGLAGTGYLGSVTALAASTLSTSNLTSGFPVTASVSATSILNGMIVIALQNPATNSWVSSSMVGQSDTTGVQVGAGSKALSGTLTTVRFTTTGGVNTFDAGSVGALFE